MGLCYMCGTYVTLLFSCRPVCRCKKPRCRGVSRVGRHYCLPTLWHCTSNRSPWLMGSPPRRSSCNNSSSSFQASQANSSLIPHRQTETGRLCTATAHVFARAAPLPAKRMVCTPPSQQKLLLLPRNYIYLLKLQTQVLHSFRFSAWILFITVLYDLSVTPLQGVQLGVL